MGFFFSLSGLHAYIMLCFSYCMNFSHDLYRIYKVSELRMAYVASSPNTLNSVTRNASCLI